MLCYGVSPNPKHAATDPGRNDRKLVRPLLIELNRTRM